MEGTFETGLEGVPYAGVGSRDTPNDVQAWMERIAEQLARDGMVLRSGGARGADTAFETGCDRAGGRKEIYLPESPDKRSKREANGVDVFGGAQPWAEPEAKRHHPAWHRLYGYGKKAMIRNVHQIVGWTWEGPWSVVVIAWTPGGNGKGGTGQAYRMAKHEDYRIPVIELACGGRVGAGADPRIVDVVRRTR